MVSRRLVVMRHAKAEQDGPTDFERPLAEVVRLLGVQREDLPRDLALRYEQRNDGFCAEPPHGFESMPAVRGPEALLRCGDRDHRIEEQPGLVDHARELFVMRIGKIALERRRLDTIDRQCSKQQRIAAEGLDVATDDLSTLARDALRHGGRGRRHRIDPAFRGQDASRARRRLLRRLAPYRRPLTFCRLRCWHAPLLVRMTSTSAPSRLTTYQELVYLQSVDDTDGLAQSARCSFYLDSEVRYESRSSSRFLQRSA